MQEEAVHKLNVMTFSRKSRCNPLMLKVICTVLLEIFNFLCMLLYDLELHNFLSK